MTRGVALSVAVTVLAAGCAGPGGYSPDGVPPPVAASYARTPAPAEQPRAVVQAGYQDKQPDPAPRPAALARPAETLFSGRPELTAADLIPAILARNPTVEQMAAAAVAAAARYPQVTSLDDPTVTFWTAPGSAGSPNADYAARVELSQKFLYPGKRGLKGQNALAEASAATRDVDDVRLQLVEAAVSALADYYAADRGLAVAGENLKLLREFRQNAEARYKTGVAQQQDVLQADVELARQEERLVSFRRARAVAVARINTLLHQAPDIPLPPPAEPAVGGGLPDVAALRSQALAARPDLMALLDRVAAEEASLALACREYKPDFELMAAYDGFWQEAAGRPLQFQIGARVNLPVRYARRGGAVAEAQAKVAQRRAELARQIDQVNLQVQEAFEQLRESEEVVALYRTRVLPAAEANVKQAQAGYVTGRVPFLSLVEAQRGLVGFRERFYELIAESARRRATLERAVGGPVRTAPGPVTPQAPAPAAPTPGGGAATP